MLECDSATRAATLREPRGVVRRWDDPLSALAWMEKHVSEAANTHGKWVGYISYDFGRVLEDAVSSGRPLSAVWSGAEQRTATHIALESDELHLPLFVFAFVDDAPPTSAPPLGWEAPIGGQACAENSGLQDRTVLRSTFSRDAYIAAVRRVIEYIRAGDVFQVNLSQRFTAQLQRPPAEVFDRLSRDTPARYAAYLVFQDFSLLSNSPELFLRVAVDAMTGKRRIMTRPIKGTRPRGAGMDVELRDSVKDQAELNMIIDLERNDLGRVCEIGSVRVTQPRTVETHPTVYHGVATVEGTLRPEVTFVDLLRAAFPGGSVTGAPKIRAMQIIDELEPVARGPYCGAIGCLQADGAMEFSLAIRTMIVKDGLVHIPVGGGVVADSDPGDEYEETLVKAEAMFRAVGGVGLVKKVEGAGD